MKTHTYYASTIGVSATVLTEEAIREARGIYGGERHDWKREYLDEYHSEVLDERGKVVDVEAKVIVRRVPS